MEGNAGLGILTGSGNTTCSSQAWMHRYLTGKKTFMQQMNIPLCFSEHTNNSKQPQCLTAINISLMALKQ